MKYFNVLGLFLAMMISATAFGDHLSGQLLITAKMTGDQEVPAVTTSATGVAGFSMNAAKDSICIDIITIGLSGPITGIHVHEGAAGTNGAVVFNLSPSIAGNRVQAVITGADLTAEAIRKFLTEGYYLNVHTEQNPNGEIRGQLKLETDKGYKADLNSAQQAHTVTSNALGLASFSFGLPGEMVEVKLATTGLSGAITMAHLHYGAVGVAGPVAVDLTPFIDGNIIEGMIDIRTVTGLMDSLKAGNVYVNIHTAANPAGEIRGQLTTNNNLMFDGIMGADQQTQPVVGSTATGALVIEVTPRFDTIYTYALVDGLSGAITMAHLHEGELGEAGGVLVDVFAGVNGNSIATTNTLDISTAAGLNTLNMMLSGNVYLNVHTTLNAPGEVRGQVYRLAREGYTVDLDGGQEVPAVTTDAQGSGIVSIDRNRMNAHYMVVVSGLSNSLTMAHFHNAAAGANGGVVYDLGPAFDMTGTEDGAFGYWTSLDANTTFMDANELMFRNDEIYVNIHTAANPSGEIRGQVTRSGACATATTTESRQAIFESVAIFPNPAVDRITLSMELKEAFDGDLFIANTLGQVVKYDNLPLGTDLSNHQIDIVDLPQGMYFLTVKNDTYSYTIRFIKE